MISIIDVSSDCSSKGRALRAAGVRTVIRYYSRDTIKPDKRLTLAEARLLAEAGLRIGIVHEGRYGNIANNFNRQCGTADAQYAIHYASIAIGQPSGTIIYYGVDYDASLDDIRGKVIPYFQGIADSLMALSGAPAYSVGVYGSGQTCQAVLNAGLAEAAWLAQSKGWSDYTSFLASGRWSLSQGMPTLVAGVECDPNEAGTGIGDFMLATDGPSSIANPSKSPMFVNARHGLKVRAGPGTLFETKQPSLPFGTAVFPIRVQDGWTLIDLAGDGKADGFVSSAFLVEQPNAGIASLTSTSSPLFIIPPAKAQTPDADEVPELIRQGSSAAGLEKAWETAKASLPGYPTNGCAAHLSALLQQAAIDVPMTWGAGKLAYLLAERQWRTIPRGEQLGGDVGVCFDNNPDRPGADHIYLVVERDGRDRMLIADNQRTANVPHERFVSGQGKTPTEYFLRAE